jgi:putative endonuclease
MRGGWMYMMANRYRGIVYTGVSADLPRRVHQHLSGGGSRFVQRYAAHRLVYAEHFERIEDAIAREKAVKKWRRAWKIELIEKANPDWLDWYKHLIGA